MVDKLCIWMEIKSDEWKEKGVCLLDVSGHTLFSILMPSGQLDSGLYAFVGSTEARKKVPIQEDDWIKIVVTRDMGLEHAQILIENAVEQVASR